MIDINLEEFNAKFEGELIAYLKNLFHQHLFIDEPRMDSTRNLTVRLLTFLLRITFAFNQNGKHLSWSLVTGFQLVWINPTLSNRHQTSISQTIWKHNGGALFTKCSSFQIRNTYEKGINTVLPPPQMLRLKVVCWPSSALLGRTYHQCLDFLTVGYLLGLNNVETFLEKCCRLHWFFKWSATFFYYWTTSQVILICPSGCVRHQLHQRLWHCLLTFSPQYSPKYQPLYISISGA